MIPYTMCSGCVFAELGNSQQVSCQLDRASKLKIQDLCRNLTGDHKRTCVETVTVLDNFNSLIESF